MFNLEICRFLISGFLTWNFPHMSLENNITVLWKYSINLKRKVIYKRKKLELIIWRYVLKIFINIKLNKYLNKVGFLMLQWHNLSSKPNIFSNNYKFLHNYYWNKTFHTNTKAA
jgi:hypothetical protein